MKKEKISLLDFIKAIRDRRIPEFGGHDCKGYGKGHGKFFLAQTLMLRKINGNVTMTNGVY